VQEHSPCSSSSNAALHPMLVSCSSSRCHTLAALARRLKC
jgi:hypothetical protein